MTMLYQNSCYNEVCCKGTALYGLDMLNELYDPGLQIKGHIVKLGAYCNFFFLFLLQNICCGYSKEPTQ